MTIAQFANAVNSCLPTIEQIKAHHLRVQERTRAKGLQPSPTPDFEEWKNQLTFIADIELETNLPEEKLAQLLEKTNIGWSQSDTPWNPPGALYFYSKARKSTFLDDSLEFAVINDYEYLAMDRQTQNIVSYFLDQHHFEPFARDFDQFLSFLVECYRYQMHYIYNVKDDRGHQFSALKTMIRQGLSQAAVMQFIHDFR